MKRLTIILVLLAGIGLGLLLPFLTGSTDSEIGQYQMAVDGDSIYILNTETGSLSLRRGNDIYMTGGGTYPWLQFETKTGASSTPPTE